MSKLTPFPPEDLIAAVAHDPVYRPIRGMPHCIFFFNDFKDQVQLNRVPYMYRDAAKRLWTCLHDCQNPVRLIKSPPERVIGMALLDSEFVFIGAETYAFIIAIAHVEAQIGSFITESMRRKQ